MESRRLVRSKWQVVAVLAALVFSSGLAAQVQSYISNAEVTNIRTYADGRFGGCSVQINKDVNQDGTNTLNCPTNSVVSVDCVGLYNSKASAQTVYGAFQLAYVAGKFIDFNVRSDMLHNESVCTAITATIKQSIP